MPYYPRRYYGKPTGRPTYTRPVYNRPTYGRPIYTHRRGGGGVRSRETGEFYRNKNIGRW